MIKTLKIIGIALLGMVIGSSMYVYNTNTQKESQGVTLGGPTVQNFNNIQPFTDNTYDNGSASNAWRRLYTYGITFSTTTAGCLQSSAGGIVYSTGSNCGSSTGLTSYDAWTHPAAGISATTSTLYVSGILSTASSTISSALRLSSLGQGFLFTGTNGLVQPIASSSIRLSWFNNDAGFITSAVTSVTGTYPIVSSGGNTPNITFLGLGTTTTWTAGQVPFVVNGNTLSSRATTSVTCSGTVSCSTFDVFGSAPITLTGSGGGGIGDPFTHPAAGQSATTSLMLLNGNASTTGLSANYAYIGQSASTTITPAGYVGIGTSTPFGNLSIHAPSQTNPYFTIGSSTSQVFSISPSTSGSATLTLSTTTAGCLNINGSGLIYSATCAGGGSVTSVVAGEGFFNRGLNITGSGTLTVGISTSTNPTVSGLSYWTRSGDGSNGATLGSVATTSVTCSGSTTCTSFTAIGGAPITISSTGGTSAFEIATTSGLTASQLAYFTKTGGMTTLGGVSTSTLTAGSGLSGSFTQLGTGGAISLNTANANNWTGLQTFLQASSTLFSARQAYFGGSATTTIGLDGSITMPSGSNLTITGKSDGCATFATGVLNSTGSACGSGGSGSGLSTTTADYIIYKTGNGVGLANAVKTSTNTVISSNVDAAVVLRAVIADATSTAPYLLTDIYVKGGTYYLNSVVTWAGVGGDDGPFWKLHGAGTDAVQFVVKTNQTTGFHYTNRVKVDFRWFTMFQAGSSSSFTSQGLTTGVRSLWNSNFDSVYFYSTTTSTGVAIDFKNDFRNTYNNLEFLAVGGCIRSRTEGAAFNIGDSVYQQMMCDQSSVSGSTPAYEWDGSAGGLVNQNVLNEVNSYSDTGTHTAYKLTNTHWFTAKGINSEGYATTTDMINSSGNNFEYNYVTLLATAGTTYFGSTGTSNNNSFGCRVLDNQTGAHRVLLDSNTSPTTPNIVQGVDGVNCKIQGSGSVTYGTTTASITRDIYNSLVPAGFLANVKILGDRIAFAFADAVDTTMRYYNSALRTVVNGTERQTILSTGNVGISSTTPFKQLSVGSGNTGTFAISTSTAGCLTIAGTGEVYSVGTACGSGSGGGTGLSTTTPISDSNVLVYSSASGGRAYGSATSSLANGTGITITNGSSAFVLGSQPTINCNTASASVFGCLSASDFSKFNSATTTFSTGLTYSGITNAVTVNTSQNIATLSNLTTNGLVTTSGGTGALSVTANGTNGQVLAMSGGVPTYVATTTAGSGLSYNGTSFLLNLANPNTWTVNQTFNYSSSTIYSSFVTASTTNLNVGFITLSTSTAGTLKTTATGVVYVDTSGGGAGYNLIQDEGSPLTARTTLNFIGSGVSCVDNAGNTRTDCTISAGAASAGGSDTQVQFNDSTALGGAVGWVWQKTKEIMGIGTTTPFTSHKVTIATSTGQQLMLASGLNDNGFGFRSIGGNLYIGTTSPTTGATSTTPILTLTSGQPQLNIGPVITFPNSLPYLHIATSTVADYGEALFHVNATTTNLTVQTSPGRESEIGVRIGVGLWNYEGYGGLLDQLVVRGRINNQDWLNNNCDNPISPLAQSADIALGGCMGFFFMEDNTGTLTGTTPTGGGASFGRVAATVANDGAGVFSNGGAGTGWLTLSSSTPVMEVNYRRLNSNATTSQYYIGYTNVNASAAGASFETEPTSGCYFVASSTTANWRAICRTAAGSANMTMVDTGVASSTITASNGGFMKFRIQADANKVEFFIKQNENSNLIKVAQISTTYPSTVLLNAGVHFGIISTNANAGFDFFRLRFWWRDNLPQL